MTIRAVCLALGLVFSACARVEPRADTPPKPVVTTPAAAEKPSKPAGRSFHDFRPSLHGFQFRNGFQGSFFGTGESAYGLCGGMSFAAADYYLAGRDIPRDIHAPADGTPMYNYIYSRQAASFGTLGAMAMKFGEWMQLPDDGDDSTHSRTLAELPHIENALARGEPIILGLVLVSAGNKGRAWDNHQVLAYEGRGAGSPRSQILIYDSNFPGRDDITIDIERDPVSIAMRIPGRRDIPIRGFFRMAYAPVTPP